MPAHTRTHPRKVLPIRRIRAGLYVSLDGKWTIARKPGGPAQAWEVWQDGTLPGLRTYEGRSIAECCDAAGLS